MAGRSSPLSLLLAVFFLFDGNGVLDVDGDSVIFVS